MLALELKVVAALEIDVRLPLQPDCSITTALGMAAADTTKTTDLN